MLDKLPGWLLEFHRSMVMDRGRVEAYRQALAEVMTGGEVVADVGCGTGILSLLACQQNARHVHAIEAEPVIAWAKKVADQNGFGDRVSFYQSHSSEVTLPAFADLLVTETIGNIGLEEGILETIKDGRQRLLRPGGQIIPHSLAIWFVPVESSSCYEKVQNWQTKADQIDFSPLHTLAANIIHWVKLEEQAFLSQPICLQNWELATVKECEVREVVRFEVTRAGTMHGIGGWFTAQLTPNVFLTNHPAVADSSWMHGFFPLEHPLAVLPHDQIELEMNILANGSIWHWQVTHHAGNGVISKPFIQSTFYSMFLEGVEG